MNSDSAEDVLWAVSYRILDEQKVLAETCVGERWNPLKLCIDTLVTG